MNTLYLIGGATVVALVSILAISFLADRANKSDGID